MTRIVAALLLAVAVGVRCAAAVEAPAAHATTRDVPGIEPRQAPPAVIDVNRPRTPFDCELPIGVSWYGSRARCLAYMCGGENVYNEYLFDHDGRRRKNPCYGQSPTDFPDAQ